MPACSKSDGAFEKESIPQVSDDLRSFWTTYEENKIRTPGEN